MKKIHLLYSVKSSFSVSLLHLFSDCFNAPLSVFCHLSQPPTDAATEKKGGGDGGGEGGQDAEEEDEPIPCTPEPKEWICLGSDKEIKEGDITETRPLVSVL